MYSPHKFSILSSMDITHYIINKTIATTRKNFWVASLNNLKNCKIVKYCIYKYKPKIS